MTVNKVILLGNVGKDPLIKALDNGSLIANVSLATTERYKDKNGERQSKTEWHNLVVFGALAKVVADYVKKGSSLYIEGKLVTDKIVKDGIEKYYTKVVVNSLNLLSSASKDKSVVATVEVDDSKIPSHAFDDDDIPF